MAIQIVCECGRNLQIEDKFAGQNGRCPSCGREFLIPTWETETPEVQANPSSLLRKELPDVVPGPRRESSGLDNAEKEEPLRGHADQRLSADMDFFVPRLRRLGW